MARVNGKVLPGFSLSLAYTLFYLTVLVLLPILACFSKAASLSFAQFWAAVWTERTRAAYALTFGASLIAATVNRFQLQRQRRRAVSHFGILVREGVRVDFVQ